MKKAIRLPKTRILSELVSSAGNNVFSPDEFKALVKYERKRSDRNGSVFSITVFNSQDSAKTGQRAIVQKISQFSRSIDCVGMGEPGQVAVLLPDTVKQGADSFGKKVLGELAKIKADRISYDIYTYPENWFSAEMDLEPRGAESGKGPAVLKDSVEYLFVDKIPVWKRALDILGASALLFLTSPIFLFLSLYIKIVSPGPVFFHQTRIGYKGVPFRFWKFRTMKCGNHQGFHGKHAQSFIQSGDIPMEKLDDYDPRIILGGRIIRKSCMDELPQIWNILKGEMSLVGPRPCIPYEAKEYLRWHTRRFDVLPGLSGLWQVSGKNKLTFKQMIRLDIEYCRNISLWGDLAIIFRTPVAILKMVWEASVAKVKEKVRQVPLPDAGAGIREAGAIETLGKALSGTGGVSPGSNT